MGSGGAAELILFSGSQRRRCVVVGSSPEANALFPLVPAKAGTQPFAPASGFPSARQ